MAREGLFNILTHRVPLEDIVVIDLFAGTGSMSYEFISRGAGQVFSVEKETVMVKFIESVAHKLNIQNLKAVQGDAFRFLAMTRIKADIVFADPPYALTGIKDIPDLVFSHQVLSDGGKLIIEHDKSLSFAGHEHFIEIRNYGKVHFSFFE